MKFIPCRRVEPPVLSEDSVRRLFKGDSIESPVPLCEGDCFSLEHCGITFAVFCSSSSGKCILRRMRPAEIQFSEENGGDSPWR
jgi:hypothetical protein